jgi:hypothetical protein
LSRIARARAPLLIPPPGIARQPIRVAASKAVQKPRNGPKEKAKNRRSPGRTPAAWNTWSQFPSIQSQLAAVSSQRRGVPVVALVWQKRV